MYTNRFADRMVSFQHCIIEFSVLFPIDHGPVDLSTCTYSHTDNCVLNTTGFHTLISVYYIYTYRLAITGSTGWYTEPQYHTHNGTSSSVLVVRTWQEPEFEAFSTKLQCGLHLHHNWDKLNFNSNPADNRQIFGIDSWSNLFMCMCRDECISIYTYLYLCSGIQLCMYLYRYVPPTMAIAMYKQVFAVH